MLKIPKADAQWTVQEYLDYLNDYVYDYYYNKSDNYIVPQTSMNYSASYPKISFVGSTVSFASITPEDLELFSPTYYLVGKRGTGVIYPGGPVTECFHIFMGNNSTQPGRMVCYASGGLDAGSRTSATNLTGTPLFYYEYGSGTITWQTVGVWNNFSWTINSAYPLPVFNQITGYDASVSNSVVEKVLILERTLDVRDLATTVTANNTSIVSMYDMVSDAQSLQARVAALEAKLPDLPIDAPTAIPFILTAEDDNA